jgi:predicted DNA-binding ribbon-helix-helix protein
MTTRVHRQRLWLNGRESVVALESCFWSALEQIARNQGVSVPCLLEEIEENLRRHDLSAAARDFVLAKA